MVCGPCMCFWLPHLPQPCSGSVGLPLGLLFGDSSLPGGGTLSGTEWAPDPPETTLQGYGPFMSSVEPRAEPGKGGGSKAQPG